MSTTEAVTEETRQLRRTLREVVALSTLPAVWAGYGPRGIAESLADVLLNTLSLDLLYLRLKDPAESGILEAARSRLRPDVAVQPQALREVFAPVLEADPTSPPETIPDPFGDGPLRVLRQGFGQAEERGLLVAGSRQADFPTEADRLLLGVAANQAAMIIQRKRAEAALHERERQLRLVADHAPVFIAHCDTEGRYKFVNRPYAERFGLTPQDVIGKRIPEVVGADAYVAFQPFVAESLAGKAIEFEVEIPYRTGGRQFMRCAYVPERDESGRVIGLVAAIINITDRKRSETLLAEQMQLLEMVASGQSRETVLHALTEAVTRLQPNVRACVLLANDDRTALADAYAAHLQPSFWKSIQGAPIGELAIGTCGAAIHQGRPITCPDVANSPEWSEPWKSLCVAHDVRACHSTPVFRPDGKAIASFFLGFAEARAPTPWELRLAEFGTHVASIVLERDRAREALRESEQRFRTMIDALPAAVYTTDAAGRLTHFNPACVTLSGHLPEIGTDHWCVSWKMYRPDGTPLPHDQCPMAVALKEGRSVRGEQIIAERPDGSRAWIEPYPTPLRDGEGNLVGGVNMLVDVTESKRAEQALRTSEERFRAIVSQASAGLAETDVTGKFTLVNHRYCEITGYSREELLTSGMRMQDITHPEDLPRNLTLFQRLVSGGPDFEIEIRYVRKDGSVAWVNNSVCAIRDETGQVRSAAAVVLDVTERVQVREALKEADRRKDEFLATLAHELRNPLAPIRNSLAILRVSSNSDPATERIHEMLERQVAHLVRLVDDLLEISRITRGKIELRKERVELARIVHSALETSKPLLESAGHQLHLALPAQPVLLEADPVRLAQVLANLLNNAAKYTEEGGQIWLSARPEPGEIMISVRDSGLGIPADMLPKVFELFAQVDRTLKRAQGGLGIGLALVKSLVQMHGGRVEARSAGPGQGSEFIIRLPLAADQPTSSPGRTEGNGQTSPLLASRRVLVVDDNRDAADSLTLLLRLLGADVQVVYDGTAALEAIHTFRPRVVLLDLGMPGMDGYEVAQRLRQEEGQGITLIALTGWGQEEDRRRSQAAGFDYHLVKPVNPEALQTLLSALPTP
jgi:PAS domain S-box-containing protein